MAFSHRTDPGSPNRPNQSGPPRHDGMGITAREEGGLKLSGFETDEQSSAKGTASHQRNHWRIIDADRKDKEIMSKYPTDN
jgi:hypothetical protein